MSLLLLLLAASPLKASADAAYRAKNYEVACPRYERLASRGRDPWAWNDWALCETRRGGFEAARTALETAAKLEAAVPEEKLRKAIEFNRRLLAEAVVACPSHDKTCDAIAHALTKLVTEPIDLRRKLYARAIERLDADELEQIPAPPVRDAIGPFEVCSALTSRFCPRELLLCELTTTSEPREYGSARTVTGWIVDPSDEAAWNETKEPPTGGGFTTSEETDQGERCPLYDDDGQFLGRPPDSSRASQTVVDADACSGRLLSVVTQHDACSSTTSRLETETLIIVRPPATSAPNVARAASSLRYDIDPAHASARFSVKHLGIGNVTGTLGAMSGQAMLDESGAHVVNVDVTIDLTAIDTKVPKRDDHLRSADFFDVSRFPTIRFTSTKIERRGKSTLAITGDLTMHGVTKPITLEAELSDEVKEPFSRAVTRGVSAKGTLNRRDWGLTWGFQFPVVADEVAISVDVEIVRRR